MGSHRFGWMIQALIIAMLAIIIALLIYLVTVEPRRSQMPLRVLPGIVTTVSHQAQYVLPQALSV
jgi:hypothetical protein